MTKILQSVSQYLKKLQNPMSLGGMGSSKNTVAKQQKDQAIVVSIEGET